MEENGENEIYGKWMKFETWRKIEWKVEEKEENEAKVEREKKRRGGAVEETWREKAR